MRLDDYSKEMMDENSFIDMAYMYLKDGGKEANLYDIIDKFKAVGGYSDKDIEDRVLQFYTDLNTDGRFLSTDDGIWGLRDWYLVDDISDKIAPTIHKIELATQEDEPEIYDSEQDGVDQDKELVQDDTEGIDTPLNNNEVESEGDLEDAFDDSIEENVEYNDTDNLEDEYEDKPEQ